MDLSKIVTDEGHHAAQALIFVNTIQDEFNIVSYERGNETPMFVKELEKQKACYNDLTKKVLFNMLIGVVTETRISKELGSFINNESIVKSVRENCKSHQDDETVHCSQFMALGKYTWKYSMKSKEN